MQYYRCIHRWIHHANPPAGHHQLGPKHHAPTHHHPLRGIEGGGVEVHMVYLSLLVCIPIPPGMGTFPVGP